MFGNVAPTAYDLRFSVLGVPVRVHPLFWVVSVMLGPLKEPKAALIWVAAVFVSIVVHEMGHALAIRAFGWRPSILLYSFGGLAMYEPTHRDPRKQILISLAGPAAGFLLAAAIVLLARAMHYEVMFHFGLPFGILPVVFGISNANLSSFVFFLLMVNIWWGLMNLLPVFPLDGGQALRELLYLFRVRQALILSLWVSVWVAGAVAAYAVTRLQDIWLALMFGFLAYSSFTTLQGYQGRGGGDERW